MTIRTTAIIGSVLVLLVMIELLRRRQLREKYAALWLVVGLGGLFIAIFPGVLGAVSRFLGFGLPVNLFFSIVGALLLVVSMQLSLEVGRLEEKTRQLAEESALTRHELDLLRARVAELEQASPGQPQFGSSAPAPGPADGP